MTDLVVADGSVQMTASAAVFDCDGILVDSESIWLQLISEVLAHVTDTDPEQFHGLSVDDTATGIAALTGAEPSAVRADLVRRYSARLTPGVAPMPGAIALVTRLAAAVPVAVASNGLRADVEMMLDSIGLLDTVHVVRTLSDVASGKPAPDLYLDAARLLGVEPGGTIAFEDSPAGSRAARAAGMTVIGVNADPAVTLDCDARFSSLTDIDAQLVPTPERENQETEAP
ncbi:HAD family hydrolase [Microbacterium halotolerans]|uniref:HAD family hydrolase n=1 Tax=Microbacterium halotolerans TaxID=246613 RepID=UPI000E6AA40F|nr:HAD family phosphatase [Microbacterium halotolerans]